MTRNDDEDFFLFCYPVYFLLDPSPPVTFVSRQLTDGTGKFGIHVFTDEAAADQYAEENNLPANIVKHAAINQPTFVGNSNRWFWQANAGVNTTGG